MLSERIGKTLEAAKAELAALKPALTEAKAKLDAEWRAKRAELDAKYRKEAKQLRALVRALESQEPGE